MRCRLPTIPVVVLLPALACAERPASYARFCAHQIELGARAAGDPAGDLAVDVGSTPAGGSPSPAVERCARRLAEIEAGPAGTDGAFAWTYAYASGCVMKAATAAAAQRCVAGTGFEAELLPARPAALSRALAPPDPRQLAACRPGDPPEAPCDHAATPFPFRRARGH